MTGELWERDEPESPCVKICVMHPAEGLCIGCLRTMDEIARWGAMTTEERRAVTGSLPGRAGRITRRRGGRAGRVGAD
ncbi:DUF1289 domain-containing protein [Paracoccus sp. S-4012]|uniref:DUF1289 domain-containing protein n=1 Tax=Paracoccus sp. S-4012 TaxID=2665648 RepID=UPI0012AFF894|nr:DUF1289 domain-containing protein [Paracoccus sp. S-4012]MRX51235.1 DUF1289 domain-containing protein [Paracoccus sp. S-4012]